MSGSKRLVFIDDDPEELKEFGRIVGGLYEYVPVLWPAEGERLLRPPWPELFVSDLYLPPRSGDATPSKQDREAAVTAAAGVSARFAALFQDPGRDDKGRLRDTMQAIDAARRLLDLQWRAMGQSPRYGIQLMAELRARCPETPYVFYSRKITPEDVVEVLSAGAADAIRKGALPEAELLARLAGAQQTWRREEAAELRARGLNVNVTLIPNTRPGR